MAMQHGCTWAIVVAVVAGCAGPAAPQETGQPGDEGSDEPQPVVLRADKPFSWAAGVGAPGGTGQSLAADDTARLSIQPDTARLNLTIRWTCGSPAPTCDLQAYVCEGKSANAPRAPCSVRASGASPLAVEALAPTPGEWTFTMRALGADARVDGVIHSEVRLRPAAPVP